MTLIYGCVTSSQLNPPAFNVRRKFIEKSGRSRKDPEKIDRSRCDKKKSGRGRLTAAVKSQVSSFRFEDRVGWKSSNFIYITHDDVPVECDRLCSDDNDTKNTTKMPNEEVLGPRKTMFVLVIVVGCFAVLWPKILSPLILGGTREQLKPNAFDREAGNVGIFNFNLNVNTAGRRVLRAHLRAFSAN